MTTYPFGDESERLMRAHGTITWNPAPGSKISEFFTGKKIFITGASGFLGKLLVEKLLRACPGIETVFVLLRSKKNEDELTRLEKIYADEIFSVLRKLNPSFEKKIEVIRGDVSLPNLGISDYEIKTLTDQVNVIFHVAATVRFDEKFPLAVNINVRGTRDLLKIAKSCKNLECFVHVSTAYSFCPNKKIEEKYYQTPISGDDLIEMVENSSEEEILKKAKTLIGPWPNNYAYTKAIAENIVKEHSAGIPTCIFRPAIVIATYKEPLRSWINNLYGPTGLIIGAGTGVLRTAHCLKEMTAEIVPGDYVINAMIAAAHKTAKEKNTSNDPVYYNFVSSPENRHTWEDYMVLSQRWGTEIPTIRCIWYYSLFLTRYKALHRIRSFFLHFLPAIFMDLGFRIMGRPPVMSKIYKRIDKFADVLSYFATQEWKFTNDNIRGLWTQLTDADKDNFPFSMANLDWNEFHKTQILGCRKYLLNEDISTLPEARKRWRRFYIAHKALVTLFYLLVARLLFWLLSTVFGGFWQ